jgi:hypothetical protein
MNRDIEKHSCSKIFTATVLTVAKVRNNLCIGQREIMENP